MSGQLYYCFIERDIADKAHYGTLGFTVSLCGESTFAVNPKVNLERVKKPKQCRALALAGSFISMRYISFINENKSTFIKILLGIFFALAVVSLVIYNVAGACCRVTPILMYHSISGGDNSLCVTPENFARQMSFLKEKGYTVISMESLVRAVNNGKKFLPRTVVITFDDGFEDNFTRAFPVLAKYDMPATIFLVTGPGHHDERKQHRFWRTYQK